MAFMNRVVNPLMRRLLSSPLHRLVSASLVLITVWGRKSGREYTLPVNYAQDGRVVWIVPGWAEKKTWWRNLLGGPHPVALTLRGVTHTANAEALQGSARITEIMAGLATYAKSYPAAAKSRGLIPLPSGGYAQADLRRVAENTVIVRAELVD